MTKKYQYCNFCDGILEDDIQCVVKDDITICADCIKRCNELVVQTNDIDKSNFKINLLKPKELKAKLDEYVIGQDNAKKSCLLQCIIILREYCKKKIKMMM